LATRFGVRAMEVTEEEASQADAEAEEEAMYPAGLGLGRQEGKVLSAVSAVRVSRFGLVDPPVPSRPNGGRPGAQWTFEQATNAAGGRGQNGWRVWVMVQEVAAEPMLLDDGSGEASSSRPPRQAQLEALAAAERDNLQVILRRMQQQDGLYPEAHLQAPLPLLERILRSEQKLALKRLLRLFKERCRELLPASVFKDTPRLPKLNPNAIREHDLMDYLKRFPRHFALSNVQKTGVVRFFDRNDHSVRVRFDNEPEDSELLQLWNETFDWEHSWKSKWLMPTDWIADPIGITHIDLISRAVECLTRFVRRCLLDAATRVDRGHPLTDDMQQVLFNDQTGLFRVKLQPYKLGEGSSMRCGDAGNAGVLWVEDGFEKRKLFEHFCELYPEPSHNRHERFVRCSPYCSDPSHLSRFLEKPTNNDGALLFPFAKEYTQYRDDIFHHRNLRAARVYLRKEKVRSVFAHLVLNADRVGAVLDVAGYAELTEYIALRELNDMREAYYSWRSDQQRVKALHSAVVQRREGAALRLIAEARNTTSGLLTALDEKGWLAESRDDERDGSKCALYDMLCVYPGMQQPVGSAAGKAKPNLSDLFFGADDTDDTDDDADTDDEH